MGRRARLRRRVTTAVIGQPLHSPYRLTVCTEPVLDRLYRYVIHLVGFDDLDGSHPAHRFPVAAIQSKDDTHSPAVVAAELEPIRTPAGIADIDRLLPNYWQSYLQVFLQPAWLRLLSVL